MYFTIGYDLYTVNNIFSIYIIQIQNVQVNKCLFSDWKKNDLIKKKIAFLFFILTIFVNNEQYSTRAVANVKA